VNLYTGVFRSGDVRGLYQQEIDEDFAYLFGRAFAEHFGLSGRVATGRDSRESSQDLQQALNAGLQSAANNVSDLGLCTTELVYFASMQAGFDAAIMVTGSHNPINSNGFKCVLAGGRTIAFEDGLAEVLQIMVRQQGRYSKNSNAYRTPHNKVAYQRVNLVPQYIQFLSGLFSSEQLNFSRIAVNGLNGTASTLVGPLSEVFDLPLAWLRKEPGPMPLQGADPSRRALSDEMAQFMKQDHYDFGVAWDGDCDRCVFYDEQGNMLPSSYAVAIFAEHFLEMYPGERIVYDNKLVFNTEAVIARLSGRPAPALTGSAFMRREMRATDAIYGGESSAHHYFRAFSGCDSGMIAWLYMLQLLQRREVSLQQLVQQSQQVARCTAEISLSIGDVNGAFSCIENRYASMADRVDQFDGLAFWMPGGWRFSLKRSKTEDLVRLNFETRGAADDLLDQGEEVLSLLRPFVTKADGDEPCLQLQ